MQRLLCLVLISLLIMAGCSSTTLAYRYADWGIVWWVDDYIPMTAAQESLLEQDIRDFRQWHCSSELPRYSEWLTEFRADLRGGDLDEAFVARHRDQLFLFLPPLVEQAKPPAIRLLQSLSDEQVEQLATNMEDSQQELEAEFLADNPQATRTARAERTIERFERWLGPLNESQRDAVFAWSDDRGGQTKIWLEGRQNWQQALLDTLDQRDQGDFAGRVGHLFDNSQAVRGERYQQMMSESQTAISSLVLALLQRADQRHLDHVLDRAEELEDDFDTLACGNENTGNLNG